MPMKCFSALSRCLAAWTIAAGATMFGPAPHAAETMATSDFLDTLGINVHTPYTDGKYADIDQVIENLNYLGVTHLRDASLDPANQGQDHYEVLAKAGFTFNFFVQGGDVVARLALIDAFEQRHPGAVASIEGPNEVNNFPIAYEGKTGDPAAIAFQAALYESVKLDPLLKALPVVGVVSFPELTTQADIANAHPYPRHGSQPRTTLVQAVQDLQKSMPGKPIYFTETGYYTLPRSANWGGVDEQAQARLTLNLLMDAASLGVRRSFLYELLDAYPDPDGKDVQRHFGLFAIDNRPKPAAVALHNLTSILAERPFAAPLNAPTALNYRISGMPATAVSMVMKRASGAFILVVWNEPPIWDAASFKPVAAPVAEVRVDLGSVYPMVKIFDPLAGSTPITAILDTRTVVLGLTDHPLIIEITP